MKMIEQDTNYYREIEVTELTNENFKLGLILQEIIENNNLIFRFFIGTSGEERLTIQDLSDEKYTCIQFPKNDPDEERVITLDFREKRRYINNSTTYVSVKSTMFIITINYKDLKSVCQEIGIKLSKNLFDKCLEELKNYRGFYSAKNLGLI